MIVEWIAQREKRLQDQKQYGLVWVQCGNDRPIQAWKSPLASHANYLLTLDERHCYCLPMSSIRAWWFPLLSTPKIFVDLKPPPRMIGTWIDGEKECPPSGIYNIIPKDYLSLDQITKARWHSEFHADDDLTDVGHFEDLYIKGDIYSVNEVWWAKITMDENADHK
jgi:hypothetical protein